MSPERLEIGRTYGERYEILRSVGDEESPTRWVALDRVSEATVEIRLADAEFPPGFIEARMALDQYVLGLRALEVFSTGDEETSSPVSVLVVDHHSGAVTLASLADTWRTAVLDVLQCVAEGLTTFHDAGFVLGALTPTNVRVVSASGHFAPVLDDLAVGTTPSGPDDGPWLTGDAAFSAPEIGPGDEATSASDVFSLGVVIAHVLSGCMPFTSRSAVANLRGGPSVLARRPRDLSTASVDLSRLDPAVRAIVAPCLALEPEVRPTARQVAKQLLDFVAPQPVALADAEVEAQPWPTVPPARPAQPAPEMVRAPRTSRPPVHRPPPPEGDSRPTPWFVWAGALVLMGAAAWVLLPGGAPSPAARSSVAHIGAVAPTPDEDHASSESPGASEPPSTSPDGERPPAPSHHQLSDLSMHAALPALGCVGAASVFSNGPPVVLELPCHLRCVVTTTPDGIPERLVRCRAGEIRMTGVGPSLECVGPSSSGERRCTARALFLLGEEERRIEDTLTLRIGPPPDP
ncbi:MAG: hypothetical protein QF464_06645 [Myxococcota bacterium]|nr:hypothetical protein [Myxococcota bacterium]